MPPSGPRMLDHSAVSLKRFLESDRFTIQYAQKGDGELLAAGLQPSWLSPLIAKAQQLAYFSPYRLIRSVQLHPAHGELGAVLADRRVVFADERPGWEVPDRKWVQSYRKQHPLTVADLRNEEIGAYFAELVRTQPQLDHLGFSVFSVTRRGERAFNVSYTHPDDPNSDDQQTYQDLVVFDAIGGIERSELLRALAP